MLCHWMKGPCCEMFKSQKMVSFITQVIQGGESIFAFCLPFILLYEITVMCILREKRAGGGGTSVTAKANLWRLKQSSTHWPPHSKINISHKSHNAHGGWCLRRAIRRNKQNKQWSPFHRWRIISHLFCADLHQDSLSPNYKSTECKNQTRMCSSKMVEGQGSKKAHVYVAVSFPHTHSSETTAEVIPYTVIAEGCELSGPCGTVRAIEAWLCRLLASGIPFGNDPSGDFPKMLKWMIHAAAGLHPLLCALWNWKVP